MTPRLIVLGVSAVAASLAVSLPAAGQSAGHTQTLRFFDKPVSIKLTHADGTPVAGAPFPEPKPGDRLDINSLIYVGNHLHHAAKSTGSTHVRCVFHAARPRESGESRAPTCESHVAIAGSLLVFTGDPGTVSNGTGVYEGATGRVISSKEVANNASDVVAQIRLAG